MMQQPTLTDGVVWLTSFTVADGASIGDFNLDEEHRRWFDQPPVDTDPDGRRRHGEKVAERWRVAWAAQPARDHASTSLMDGDMAARTARFVPAARRLGAAWRATVRHPWPDFGQRAPATHRSRS